MRKNEITASLVSRLVAEQFPAWRDLVVERVEPGGWDNATFRIGQELLARLPSADLYAAQVTKEQRWLPYLATRLPVPIPAPVATGRAGFGYPWPWSVYRWLDGETATLERVPDLPAFAADLASFLAALHRIEPSDGPPPGEHNFFRGGPLSVYDAETRDAIAVLGDQIDGHFATLAWEAALKTSWRGSPAWIHGDVVAANLLVRDGRLSAVIDFGCCGVGDPACDLAIAWTFFFAESREAFRACIALDEATWARGRGWALWKALITCAQQTDEDPEKAARRFGWRQSPQGVIQDILAECVQTS
jgi:aminoglycoside phosphotransferase (APT) family kinase protein